MFKLLLFCVLLILGDIYGRQLLEPNHPFNRDVSCENPVSNSRDIVEAIATWGTGSEDLMRITRDLVVGEVGPGTAWVPFIESPYYYDYECDSDVTTFPLPIDSGIEGSSTPNDYACSGGDCHVLTIDVANATIWEGFACNFSSGALSCNCVAKWYMCGDYPLSQRGRDCTSADAAGFTLAALTPTVDEVLNDDLNHALRFILRNEQIRADIYGYPATHSTFPTAGGSSNPWYGVRLRLRADFDDSGYNEYARIILNSLKRYGMFLADGGNIPLTFAADFNSPSGTTWDDLLGPGNPDTIFDNVSILDFEVMPTDQNSPLVTYESNCVLNTIPTTPVCAEIISGIVNTTCVVQNPGGGSGGSSSSSSIVVGIF